MKMTRKLPIFLISVALVVLTGGAMAEAPPPGSVSIRNIAWSGSGCPPGSVAQNVAPDNKAFTLAFSQYIASAGPDVPITETRKNCNVILNLVFPQGWSFTIFNVDYRGYALLDPMVTGTQRSAYFFEGDFPSAALDTTLYGSFDDNYEIRDTLGLEALVWSPCGVERALNVNTEVRVNNLRNRRGVGLMTLDTLTGELTHIYGLMWRRC